jgi:hypothetical protein
MIGIGWIELDCFFRKDGCILKKADPVEKYCDCLSNFQALLIKLMPRVEKRNHFCIFFVYEEHIDCPFESLIVIRVNAGGLSIPRERLIVLSLSLISLSNLKADAAVLRCCLKKLLEERDDFFLIVAQLFLAADKHRPHPLGVLARTDFHNLGEESKC